MFNGKGRISSTIFSRICNSEHLDLKEKGLVKMNEKMY